MTSPTSRRALLLAGAAGLVSGCGGGSGPRAAGKGPRVDGRFTSEKMGGASVGWTLAYPDGHHAGERLPVVVSLHGRGATHRTTFTVLGLAGVLDRLVAHGVPAFALASVDGGDHGYWHRRTDGTDAGAMVVDELVPMLGKRGLDTGRLGLYGWSMGGYGALLLAGGALPAAAVAVASPALFTSSGSTPSGAFDDAEDYARNDVFGHPERLATVPLRIDCGRSDPFFAATRDFVGQLKPHPAGGFQPGRHDAAYWRRQAPAELSFLGRRLSAH